MVSELLIANAQARSRPEIHSSMRARCGVGEELLLEQMTSCERPSAEMTEAPFPSRATAGINSAQAQ